MPEIPYLDGGESATAARMDALYTEFERKLEILLHGKSPLISINFRPGAPDSNRFHLFGRFAYFIGAGTRVYTDANAVNYNHQKYASALAQHPPAVQLFDAELGIVGVSYEDYVNIDYPEFLSVPAFYGSLQVHTTAYQGQQYPICFVPIDKADIEFYKVARPEIAARFLNDYKFYSQRVSKYNVLEVVCENNTVVQYAQNWTKFSYLRVHNLSPYPMRFEWGTFNVVIPAYECKTIYRNPLNGVIETQGKYFWNFESGQPRMRHMYGFSEANNTCNPRIAVRWIDTLTQNVVGRFGFIIDHTVQPDFYDRYRDKYGDPNNPGTKLADLFHHKGQLMVMKTPLETNPTPVVFNYEGRNKLQENFTAAGFTVTRDADGTYRLKPPAGPQGYDMVSLTTNVLKQGAVQRPVVTIGFDPSINLLIEQKTKQDSVDYGVNNQAFGLRVRERKTYSAQFQWDESGQTVTGSANYIAYESTFESPPRQYDLDLSTDSFRQILGDWGFTAITGNLNTQGFGYYGSYNEDLTWPDAGGGSSAFISQDTEFDGQTAITYRRVRFKQQGWPDFITYEYPTGALGSGNGWYMTPCNVNLKISVVDLSVRRSLAGTLFAYSSLADKSFSAQGRDWDFNGLVAGISEINYSIQQAVPSNLGIFGITTTYTDSEAEGSDYKFCPDVVPEVLANYQTPNQYRENRIRYLEGRSTQKIYGGTYPYYTVCVRVALSADDYNDIAWKINRLTKCVPMDIQDHRLEYQGLFFTLRDAAWNGAGIVPMRLFCRVTKDTNFLKCLEKYNVQIFGEEDLPEQYHDFNENPTVTRQFHSCSSGYSLGGLRFVDVNGVSYSQVLVSTSTPANPSTGSEQQINNDWHAAKQKLIGTPTTNNPYLWVSVDQIKQLAQRIGLSFLHVKRGVPLKLMLQDSTPPFGVSGDSIWSFVINRLTGQRLGGIGDPFAQDVYDSFAKSGFVDFAIGRGIQPDPYWDFVPVGADKGEGDNTVPPEEAQFIRGGDPMLCDYRRQALTNPVSQTFGIITNAGNYPIEYNLEAFAYDASGLIPIRNGQKTSFSGFDQDSPTPDFRSQCLTVTATAGFVNESTAIIYPWYRWHLPANWSTANKENAKLAAGIRGNTGTNGPGVFIGQQGGRTVPLTQIFTQNQWAEGRGVNTIKPSESGGIPSVVQIVEVNQSYHVPIPE